MFERYTESARRVLFFARYEASQLGGTAIETDHILLGLTREAKGIICEVFALSHVSLKSIRHDIEARAPFGEKQSASVELPFSEDARRVLLGATEEADRLRHPYIGTEHLLLGLLRESTSPAGAILTAHGLRLNDVREEIVKLSEPSAVLASSTRIAEAGEHIERIKHLIGQLAETRAEDRDARQLVEHILRDLDALKRRFLD